MTRDQLEHAIRAACDVADDTDLFVFGSQAILGEHPTAPPGLRTSIEVDVQPVNNPEAVDSIDGALGELSLFHEAHGFYVHGVSIEAASLPGGWEDRTIAVPGRGTQRHTGHCLESHDLAASKLVAFRDKDRDFVRTLLIEGLIRGELLVERVRGLSISDALKDQLEKWVSITVEDL